MCRIVFARCNVAEERLNDSHDESRRNAFAADIANTEEHLPITDEGIVEITSDSLRRYQSALYSNIIEAVQRRLFLWQKSLLYVACNTKFACQTFLLQCLVSQFLLVFSKTTDQIEQDAERQQRKQKETVPQFQERAINFIIVANDGYLPMWYAPHIDIEDGTIAIVCVEVYHFASSLLALTTGNGAIIDERGDILHFLI